MTTTTHTSGPLAPSSGTISTTTAFAAADGTPVVEIRLRGFDLIAGLVRRIEADPSGDMPALARVLRDALAVIAEEDRVTIDREVARATKADVALAARANGAHMLAIAPRMRMYSAQVTHALHEGRSAVCGARAQEISVGTMDQWWLGVATFEEYIDSDDGGKGPRPCPKCERVIARLTPAQVDADAAAAEVQIAAWRARLSEQVRAPMRSL